MEKDEKDDGKKPTTLIVMGMAGSGKTTFVQRLTASLNMANQERPPYVINLDPAVADLQFPVSYRFFTASSKNDGTENNFHLDEY